jgi:hypothetical protein
MAKDVRPRPVETSPIDPRTFRREVMAMEGRRMTGVRRIKIDRSGEPTRLGKQLMARAYEQVYPVLRATLGRSRVADRGKGRFERMPRSAAGG